MTTPMIGVYEECQYEIYDGCLWGVSIYIYDGCPWVYQYDMMGIYGECQYEIYGGCLRSVSMIYI